MERMIADLPDLTRTRLGGAMRRGGLGNSSDSVVRFESRADATGHWDADRLAQVVSNLVGDAIEHGAEAPVDARRVRGGRAPEAHRSQQRRSDPVAGSGHDLRVAQSRDVGQPTQLGLGLFIARAMVIAHGGEIGVTSTAESGTTFEVALPR